MTSLLEAERLRALLEQEHFRAEKVGCGRGGQPGDPSTDDHHLAAQEALVVETRGSRPVGILGERPDQVEGTDLLCITWTPPPAGGEIT